MFKNFLDAFLIIGLFLLLAIIFILVVVLGSFVLLLQIPRHLILKPLKLDDYLTTIILALDSFAGSIIYGRRGRLFYISSIAYYDAYYHNKNVWFRKFIDLLFFLDSNHTKKSFLAEANRMGLVPQLSENGYLLKWNKESQSVRGFI